MTGDDKPKALPLPNVIEAASGERGGSEERVMKSVQRAIVDARARETSSVSTIETTDAIERRRLIIEIQTMRRYRLNVAFEGIITGAIYTGGAWALFRLGRWILDELRSPPKPPPEPQSIQQPTSSAP